MATKRRSKTRIAWTKNLKEGQLHRDLGIPQGQKIPRETLLRAAKRKDVVGRRARAALIMSKWKKGGRKKSRR